MIILGLDLSIAKTGICLAESPPDRFNSSDEIDVSVKTISTKPRDPLGARLKTIRDSIRKTALNSLIDPDIAVIEEPIQHRQHKSGQMSLHALYGVARLLLYEHDIKVEWVHPKTLKKVTTGNGNASKGAMIRAVKLRWDIDVKDDNEADAVALAMYGLGIAREKSKGGR